MLPRMMQSHEYVQIPKKNYLVQQFTVYTYMDLCMQFDLICMVYTPVHTMPNVMSKIAVPVPGAVVVCHYHNGSVLAKILQFKLLLYIIIQMNMVDIFLQC